MQQNAENITSVFISVIVISRNNFKSWYGKQATNQKQSKTQRYFMGTGIETST